MTAMTVEMWIALGILVVAIVLFITEWLRVDVVALGVMVALTLTGLISSTEAISGFSNPAVLTIAALFVVGGAVMQTGVAAAIGERILLIAGTNPVRLTVVIMLAVALLSSVMSSTGTVAVLLPAIVSLAASAKISNSKLLMPLAFGSLLGGALTLIGTAPNVIVSDLLREQGLEPFRFFDYTPIGIALVVAGGLFMVLVGRRLLPDHKPKQDVQRIATPEELVAIYRLPENLFRLRVLPNSNLIGKTAAEARLRRDFGLTVVNVLRARPSRRPAGVLADRGGAEGRSGRREDDLETIVPTPETIFRESDILVAKGETSYIGHTAAHWKLGVQPARVDDDMEEPVEQTLVSQEAGVAEVLLPPRSSLLGKNLVDSRFGTLYGLTVLGITRPGTDEPLNLKETPLRFGDTLLVQGPWQNILALKERPRDFVVMGEFEEVMGPPAQKKAPVAILILGGMLLLMIGDVVPLVTASLLAGLAMILTRCVTIDEAYDAVDWKSIVLIAGMLPMSIALERVGLVDLVATGLTDHLGAVGPTLVLGGLFLLTSLFTQVISNTATTVLMAPIALAAAAQLNVSPYAFMMGVAVSASMAFASPVATPANTLVMGAGQYRFIDYIKVGVPMILITLVVSTLVLPMLFSF
jgi:di/tricarboxylate transporter